MSVFRQCSALVGNDSGLAHLAVAVGTPAVTIYGSTNPSHSKPLGRAKTVAVVAKGAKGTPKLHLKNSTKAVKLMQGISVEAVFKAVRAVVRQ